MIEEERPARKLVHEVGQPLDTLSVHELAERIALLRGEIERIEAARTAKLAAAEAAASVFGRPGG